MQFKKILRRRASDNMLPMINIVFLLLIFFMIVARLDPKPPFDITPPIVEADSLLVQGKLRVFLSKGGMLAYDGRTGEDAWERFSRVPATSKVILTVDAQMPASLLAHNLMLFANKGLDNVALTTLDP